MARVIETLETFIAEKNANQCNAIRNPTKQNFNKALIGILILSLLKDIKMRTKKDPNNILYQTKGMASIEIRAPNTAVKPQINTIKCKWR